MKVLAIQKRSSYDPIVLVPFCHEIFWVMTLFFTLPLQFYHKLCAGKMLLAAALLAVAVVQQVPQ